MTTTDSPLKQLVDAFSADFAAWLLEADVREIHALPVELPGQDMFADLTGRTRYCPRSSGGCEACPISSGEAAC